MHRPSPVLRIAAALALVAWVAGPMAPAPAWAADDEAEAAEGQAQAADDEAEAAEGEAEAQDEQAAPAPVETDWYDPLVHNANIGADLIVIRPLALITLGAGAALLVPAALLTAPNGWDSVKDAYQRFVGEPTEYAISRPLGEF